MFWKTKHERRMTKQIESKNLIEPDEVDDVKLCSRCNTPPELNLNVESPDVIIAAVEELKTGFSTGDRDRHGGSTEQLESGVVNNSY